MTTQKIYNIDNLEVGEVKLNDPIYQTPLRQDIIARVVAWQLSKRRSGTHQTREIAEISGTTKKMYRQKGTGGARHGSKRAPQFRGGAVIFGPHFRDHGYDIQKKVRRLALKSILSHKLSCGKVTILDSVEINEPKTKLLKNMLEKFGITSALMIDSTLNSCPNTTLAVSNIHGIDILPTMGANVYDIVRKDHLFMTVEALKALEERLR